MRKIELEKILKGSRVQYTKSYSTWSILQCDQIARLFFNIWGMFKFWQFAKLKICPSRFKILPKTKYDLEKWPKGFHNLAKVAKSCRCHKQILAEPWSRGYWRRLIFQRSWIWIPAPYTRWTFFTFICCQNCNVCLKRRK